jgi:hypothetical protein
MTWTALVVGNGIFPADPQIRALSYTNEDVTQFENLLGEPVVGKYVVLPPLRDEPHTVVGKQIELLLRDAKIEDRVLMYFSGHGRPDGHGHLRLLTVDSELKALGETSVAARSIHDFPYPVRAGRAPLI